MSDALTRDERRIWKQGTDDIATNPKGFVSIEVLAMNRRRYEATLREQDERITALVEALGAGIELLEDYRGAEHEGSSEWIFICCAEKAIKEATS